MMMMRTWYASVEENVQLSSSALLPSPSRESGINIPFFPFEVSKEISFN